MKNDPNVWYYGQERSDENMSILEKAIAIQKEMGFRVLFKRAFSYIMAIIPIIINAILEAITYKFVHRTFIVNGKRLRYFLNRYQAVDSERSIEIPIAMDFISESAKLYADNQINGSHSILELGNVINHYFEFRHTVIDKYEKWPGVLNVDVTDFASDEKYDLIISISTVEHIGYDEKVKCKSKPLKALIGLQNLLASGGKMLITVPLGYNPEIDKIVKDSLFTFKEKYFLKRVSYTNTWKETTMEDALKYKYGVKYNHANSLAVLIFNSNSSIS